MNNMAKPKITKVVLNIGLKEAVTDKGVLARASEQLATIAGQKPKVTRAKTSLANFKVREGDPVGLTVTLRGKRMDGFLRKLFTIVLPRVRDFQGLSTTAFDKTGNYTLGLSEQIVFPEIDFSKIEMSGSGKIRGLEITIVNTAGSPEASREMLTEMGMPFRKNG